MVDAFVFDSRFYDVVPHSAVLRRLATGFGFTEGPVWDASRQCLWFSDIDGDTTYGYQLHSRTVVIRRHPSFRANGMTIDNQGRLVVCEQARRCVSVETSPGQFVSVVDQFHGRRFNSPNDVITQRDGQILFTDPVYGLEQSDPPQMREQPIQGVYRVNPTTNAVELVVDDCERPNGLAWDVDERHLYVSDTAHYLVRRFTRTTQGLFDGNQVVAVLDPTHGPGFVDGLKVDAVGRIWVTGPGGVWVWDPDGRALGIIHLPEVVANMAWGEGDPPTVYCTATHSIYALDRS